MSSTILPPSSGGASERTTWQKGVIKKEGNDVTSKVGEAALAGKTSETTASPSKKITPLPSKSSLLPPSKERGLLKLSRAVLEQKAGVLKAIFFRLGMSPAVSISGSTQKAFFSTGIGLGGILGLVSFPAVVMNIADTVSLIRDLHRTKQATAKNVLKVLFHRTVVKEPFLLDLTNMAQGAVLMALSIGSLTNKLSPAVVASLGVALKALGGAAGGLAILFGSIQIGLGIKGVLAAKKKVNKAEEALKTFNASHTEGTQQSLAVRLQRLHHTNAVKQANREKAQAILKACMGAFMTVAGALGIATIFTGGWAALGIAIAGSVLGGIALIVSVGNAIKEHRTDKRLQKEFTEILSGIDLSNDEQWVNLSRELGIQASVPKEEREVSLKNYCLGKTIGGVVIGAQRIPRKSS